MEGAGTGGWMMVAHLQVQNVSNFGGPISVCLKVGAPLYLKLRVLLGWWIHGFFPTRFGVRIPLPKMLSGAAVTSVPYLHHF
jgi:hypothetical protein